ncbi:MAG: dienelactone hydrolase family protein [Alsobacter sp.]
MQKSLKIATQDGTCAATLVTPETGAKGRRGVILYMDAFGPRPALTAMAGRLAGEGYAVLVPDLFYRQAPYGPFDAKTSFGHEESRKALMGLIQGTTQAMTARDTGAFLDALSAVGAEGPVGVVGYCMGGGRALTAAGTYPDKVAAAASFHGGGLASDAPDSPHRLATQIRARVYVGVAGVDNSFPPEQSARLAQALREAEVDHLVENYVGKSHGWCVPDHGVYDEAGAERHWKRLITVFGETLV